MFPGLAELRMGSMLTARTPAWLIKDSLREPRTQWALLSIIYPPTQIRLGRVSLRDHRCESGLDRPPLTRSEAGPIALRAGKHPNLH